MLHNYVTKGQRPAGPNDVQVRVRRGCMVEGRSEGAVFWVSRDRARMYVGMKSVEIVGGSVLTDAEKAIKDEGTQEGKSYGARSDGPSTDTASSTKNGQGVPLSASAADPALPQPSQGTSLAHDVPTNAALSQSTTPTQQSQTPTSSTLPTGNGGHGTRTGRSFRRGRS